MSADAAELSTPPEAIRQVMAGLMFSLSKNSYEGTPYCVDLISQLYARSRVTRGVCEGCR